MIGNEMNRASKLLNPEDRVRRAGSYERVLRLVAGLYVEPQAQPSAHKAAFRALLWLTPEASRQIPHVIG
jgi:hypothetical protein